MNENTFDFAFGNTANFDPNNLTTDKVTLAFFGYDISGSMKPHTDKLNEARRSSVERWKKSHHADSILYGELTFNEKVVFSNGFLPVSQINAQDVQCHGLTALYESICRGLKHTWDYKNQLEATGVETDAMMFFFTDGEDNPALNGQYTLDTIKNLMDQVNRDESFNYNLFVYAMCEDKYGYFRQLSDAGVKVLIKDPSDPRTVGEYLRDNVTVVSQSVSSGDLSSIDALVI